MLALILSTLVPASAAPALAQGEGNVRAPDPAPDGAAPATDDNTLYRGSYAVTEEGALIYGGDAVYQCDDLVRLGAPANPGSETPTINGSVLEPLTREAVELCAKAGFPPEGAIFSDSTEPGTLEASERDTLPTTGGLVLAPLVLGAVALAAITMLLVHGTRR